MNESFRLTKKLLVQQRAPLLVIFAISCALNVTVEDALQLATPTEETQRWILQLLMGLWDLIEGVLMLLVLSWGIPKVRAITAATLLDKPFAAPYLQSFLAEYLRLLAQVLMWGLLLILPGFYRYCQLTCVPLIALFSKGYRAGDIDALQLSEKLAKGRLRRILLALGLTMGVEAALEFLPEMVPTLHILPLRVLFDALGFMTSIWAYALIFLLFEDAMEEQRPEEQ